MECLEQEVVVLRSKYQLLSEILEENVCEVCKDKINSNLVQTKKTKTGKKENGGSTSSLKKNIMAFVSITAVVCCLVALPFYPTEHFGGT